MNAEIVAVNGPDAGRKYPLKPGESFAIGRAPANSVRLLAACEPRHCVLSHDGDAWWLVDLSTPGGTFVNGARVQRRRLEDNDQIRIGPAVLMFRRLAVPPSAGVRTVLLEACMLSFLFRALALCESGPQRQELENQVLRLVADLAPSHRGWLVLAGDPPHPDIDGVVKRVEQAGPLVDAPTRLAGVPIYVPGTLWGVLVVHLTPEGAAQADECIEILTALSTLAGMALENAREVATLQAANEALESSLGLDTEFVGTSAPVQRLLQFVERVAPRETTVLIQGESGTGKELVARTLHRNSPRRHGPFVAINCAALTETLLESELFGHEKGSFTGATAQKKGKLEVAARGTVFLDEIGELALSLQAKLLRVLQQREFERVGSTETRTLDIRLVAATNRDLALEVRQGRFREDLFHRLSVVLLRTPPLRERPEDILPLARHFLVRIAAAVGRTVDGFSPEAEQNLLNYDWPGNVRELENAVERAVVLGVSRQILPEDLPETVLDAMSEGAVSAYQLSLSDAKRESILRAYEQARGDYKAAARILGLHPNYLLRLVRNLGIREQLKARLRSAGF